jgi:hypothetical protein
LSRPRKPQASLDTKREDVPGVLARAKRMETAISAAGASFPALPVSMVAFLVLLQAAAAAQLAAATRAVGLASLRDVKVDVLWTAMNSLKTYVHGLARSLDATAATALIESAGLVVGQAPMHVKPLFSAKYVTATGVVRLSVNALMLIGKRSRKKTTFTFSWSADGGLTWTDGSTVAYTSLDVAGLPPGTYVFRVFATVGRVPGDPVQSESLTIH